jgi:cytochrome bd-type quinol oxidase subunit 2
MNKFWKGVLLNISGVVVLALLAALANARDASMVFGLVTILISVVELVLGLFLLLFPAARKAAQIILAGCGIIFLIGLSVCSIFPNHFNFH